MVYLNSFEMEVENTVNERESFFPHSRKGSELIELERLELCNE